MRSPLHADGHPLAGPAGGRSPLIRSEERLPLIFLGTAAAAICLLLALSAAVPYEPSTVALGELALLAASLASAGALWSLATSSYAWSGTRWAARASAAAVAFQLVALLTRVWNGQPSDGGIAVGTTIFLLAIFVGAFVIDFFQHVTTGRIEVLSDAAVVAVLAGSGVFLLQHGEHASGSAEVLPALVALEAVVVFAGWSILCLWCPSAVHMALFSCASLAGGAALFLSHGWHHGALPDTLTGPSVGVSLSILALTGILVVEPRLNTGRPIEPRAAWWVRPFLLALSLFGAFVLVFMALFEKHTTRLPLGQSVALASAAFAAIGIRSVVSQVGLGRATTRLQTALHDREAAITSLRKAADDVSASEARLRLILDAAVDGVVELDSAGSIIRVNDAFCAMVRLTAEEIVGREWAEMAALAGDPGGTLAGLPQTGEAAMVTESGTAYLEARSSTIPTAPPGRLLLIRDVTPSKVAEQTIRTLLQFLQDRDEDRTRLLKRTNAAIEVERNRIARDLHDGPVQGISAAALSVEAVRLMVKQGDFRRAALTLKTLSSELSQEAIGLRQVMSDLRPPVLEQRGLIPAVRDLCLRLQRDLKMPVEVAADSDSDVPNDVETLAYRVIQEALTNVGKHSGALEVWVRIHASAGILRVEVEDNGIGFEVERTRDFLHAGKVGLASMRERAELAGGTFSVRSSPDTGATVLASLPYEMLPTTARPTSNGERSAEASG
jgi:PAS domain S-box-containing protein